MTALTVLIIEDEKPAQRILQQMLADMEQDIEVVGCLDSIQASLRWFAANTHPDLVLMDIQLSDGISFSILEQTTIDSMIIFTTAYDEYAIQAFKVNSLDYLLKPIEPEELAAAFAKFSHYSQTFLKKRNEAVEPRELLAMLQNAETRYRKRFLIQVNQDFHQIPVEEIAFFHSMQKITFAVTFDQKSYGLKFSLERLVEQLDPDQFFKVNRQFIINLNAIKNIQTYFQGKLVIKAEPAHDEAIIVGKDKAASFKRWLDR